MSEHCSEMFPLELKRELAKKPQDMGKMLEIVFEKIDCQLKLMDADHCGATVCVAVVRREANRNVLYVANCGDTRAVLSKSGTAERLSKDHKASDP